MANLVKTVSAAIAPSDSLASSQRHLSIKDLKREDATTSTNSITNKKGHQVKVGNAAAALHSIENDFGSWGPAAQCLYIGHLFWLLKEIFWILLIPYPALGFGALCWLLFMFSIGERLRGGQIARFYEEAPVEILIHMMQLSWQTFNCILMVASFLFDEPAEVPSYAEDIVPMNDCWEDMDCWQDYDNTILVVRIGFGMTFVIWLAFCAFLLYEWFTPPHLLLEGYAFQTCFLQGGWLAWWIAKDFSWTFDNSEAVAIPCYCIHFILLCVWLATVSTRIILVDGLDADELQKFADEADFVFDRSSFSYVLWSLSSLIWYLCENNFDDNVAMRYVSAGLCGLSFLMYASAYHQVKTKALANDAFIRMLRSEAEKAEPATAWQDTENSKNAGDTDKKDTPGAQLRAAASSSEAADIAIQQTVIKVTPAPVNPA